MKSFLKYGNEKSENLNSLRGQLNRYNWRKYFKCLYLGFDCEIKSKRGMHIEDKIEFQQNVLKLLKERKRSTFRGTIAAQILINVDQQNPPHIHTVTKNLLDLLSKPIAESRIKRKGLVYNDDSQIGYLSISYRTLRKTNSIMMKFMPLRDFIKDINLAFKLIMGHYEECDSMYEIKQEFFLEDDVYYDDELYEFEELKINKKKYFETLGEDTYNILYEMSRRSIQDHFLNSTKIKIQDLYYFLKLAGKIKDYSKFNFPDLEIFEQQSANQYSNWIINSKIKLNLPQIPTKEGESQKFKKSIRKVLEKYKQEFKILSPLYSPVHIEVIYKAPKTHPNFKKDLDNIMLSIIPIFTEIFKPPVLPLMTVNKSNYKNELPFLQSEIPKSLKYSVSGYDIIEIPRTSNDNDNGFLLLSITRNKFGTRSLWERIDYVISKCEENFRYM